MSIWHLVLLLVVVVVIFGTGKLRNVGSDLGAAIRDFKKGLNDNDKDEVRREEARREAEHLRADPPPAYSQNTTQNTTESAAERAARDAAERAQGQRDPRDPK